MKPLFVGAALLIVAAAPVHADTAQILSGSPSVLSLAEALELAVASDPWQVGSEFRERALIESSEAIGQLPDPRVKLMAGNLPVDSWSLNQEPMTHLSVGFQQVIPRGDSLSLKRARGYQQVSEERVRRSDRYAQVRLQVSHLWLDVVQSVMTRDRLRASKALLHNLEELIQARYRTGMAEVSQSDLVRASVELTRIDERIAQADQNLAVARQRLHAWIGERANNNPGQLPELEVTQSPLHALLAESVQSTDLQLFNYIENHPRLRALATQVEAAKIDVALAEESVKPSWAIEASYGYRADDRLGRDRADLFSVGLSFELPMFTSERQDRSIRASKATAASVETDRQLVIRELMKQLRSALVTFKHAQARYRTYIDSLIPQLQLHVETSLLAYNNDQSELSEAIVAHITALNTDIDFIRVDIERRRALASLNYFTYASAGSDGAVQQEEG